MTSPAVLFPGDAVVGADAGGAGEEEEPFLESPQYVTFYSKLPGQ
jgi:hypothetical protein